MFIKKLFQHHYASLKRSYHILYLLGKTVGLLHGLRLAVDANDRLRVRLAKVNPTVGEINLDAINVGDSFI